MRFPFLHQGKMPWHDIAHAWLSFGLAEKACFFRSKTMD